MMLVVAVPNCQWGNLKYAKFDGRDHVGIGAWETCSVIFESEQDWAKTRSECSQADLNTCASIKDCKIGDFSDQKGSNTDYEKSWVNCRKICSPKAWEAHCISMGCGGSQHTVQCNNVTKAVHQDFQVSYVDSSEPAWTAGDRCRGVGELCDNDGTLGQVGGFGWASFAFACIAQMLLVAHATISNKARKLKVLVASLANFAVSWVCLLVCWALFANAVGSKATCTVIDASATGAVRATGNFGDIINASGSYSYYFVVLSWLLTTLVIGVLAEHIYALRKRGPAQKTADDAAMVPKENASPADVAAPAEVPEAAQTCDV